MVHSIVLRIECSAKTRDPRDERHGAVDHYFSLWIRNLNNVVTRAQTETLDCSKAPLMWPPGQRYSPPKCCSWGAPVCRNSNATSWKRKGAHILLLNFLIILWENWSGPAIRIDERSRGWPTEQSKCINLGQGHTFSQAEEIITIAAAARARPIISSHQHLLLLWSRWPPISKTVCIGLRLVK